MNQNLKRGALVACVALAAPAAVAAAVTKPPVVSRPAGAGNFTRQASRRIDMVVVHKAQGDNASGYFQTPGIAVSAHYDVHHDGTIYQSVADHDIAWHAGNWAINVRSIGIEQSGYVTAADTTDVQYRSFAKLVAYLSAAHGIPVDRQHIIGHSEVPDPFHPGEFGGADHHTDPGVHWDWAHFMNLVRMYKSSGTTPPPPAPKPPAPRDTASLASVTGNLTFNPGDLHEITVAFRNTGNQTWTPGKTELAEDVTPRRSFMAPLDATTKPTQVGLFKFNVHIPAGASAQTVTEKLAIFDSGALVASGVVGIKITIR